MESAGLVPCADDERDISWATKEKKMLNERKIKKKKRWRRKCKMGNDWLII